MRTLGFSLPSPLFDEPSYDRECEETWDNCRTLNVSEAEVSRADLNVVAVLIKEVVAV